jgi:hypothetical protein
MKKNTQTGFLKIIENLVLIHPIFCLICRKFAQHFSIYESEMNNLKKYINKKINIIDIGASDGISAKYFIKNFNIDKIYCFEPNKIYYRNLENLKKLAASNKKIKFLDLVPKEDLNFLLNVADVHLLIQKNEIDDQVMPSKLANMIASGGPIVATVNETSRINALFMQHGLGITVAPNKYG